MYIHVTTSSIETVLVLRTTYARDTIQNSRAETGDSSLAAKASGYTPSFRRENAVRRLTRDPWQRSAINIEKTSAFVGRTPTPLCPFFVSESFSFSAIVPMVLLPMRCVSNIYIHTCRCCQDVCFTAHALSSYCLYVLYCRWNAHIESKARRRLG